MTLNFSNRPIFVPMTNTPQDGLISSMGFGTSGGFVSEGVRDMNETYGYCNSGFENRNNRREEWEWDWGFDEFNGRRAEWEPGFDGFNFNGGGGECEWEWGFDDFNGGKGEWEWEWGSPTRENIVDRLPNDPFGMDATDIETITALTSWFSDIDAEDLSKIFNQAMMFQAEPDKLRGFEESRLRNERGLDYDGYNVECRGSGSCSNASCGNSEVICWTEYGGESRNVCLHKGGVRESENLWALEESKLDMKMVLNSDEYTVECRGSGKSSEGTCSSGCGGEAGAPHDALLYALGYLGVWDLLRVEGVCKFLHDSVQDDPWLWRSIYIDESLNDRIGNESLLKLTGRAQGNLQCLSLSNCNKITDDGLRQVLEDNPKLSKLSIPGCKQLTTEGIVNNLKALKSSGALGLDILRLGDRYVTDVYFEELKNLLGVDNFREGHTPRFFHESESDCDDDRSIDIEKCPKCKSFTLVYDCPGETCQENSVCKACILCIERCVSCGRCMSGKFVETFCLDYLCYDCDMEFSCECQHFQAERDGHMHGVRSYRLGG